MDELLETVAWLEEVDDKALFEIFERSFALLQGPVDRKTLQELGNTLERTPEMLERTMEAVGFIITSICTKRTLPEIAWIGKVEAFIKEKETEVKLSYSQNSLHNPFFSDFQSLDWRLEVQVSSRALEDITVPKVILQISTTKEEKILEVDYSNLKNLYNQLKLALKSFDSVRAKKAENFLKGSKAL